MKSDYEIAKETAEKLVRHGPEMTGCAEPRCWWVYLGDYAISDLRCTEEEAKRIAASYHPDLTNAILSAIREARALGGKEFDLTGAEMRDEYELYRQRRERLYAHALEACKREPEKASELFKEVEEKGKELLAEFQKVCGKSGRTDMADG